MHYVLALDLGTSSTRSALFDQKGNQVPSSLSQQSYGLTLTPDGGAELDASVLAKAVNRCWQQTLATPIMGDIVGIGVSGFWHSLLGVDKDGQALTPIFTWADSRSAVQAARLSSQLSERAVHRRTGCRFHSSFWPAKLQWLHQTRPRLWRKVRRWLSPAEWIQEKFCGESLCSLSMASGTGLFDSKNLRWDPALLKICRLPLAKLNRISEDSLTLSPRAQRSLPLLAKARWFPALGDGAASNLGSGAVHPNVAAINLGTSGAVRMLKERNSGSPSDFGLFCYCVDGKRQLIGGAISNAGNLRAWALRELRVDEQKLVWPSGPTETLTVLPFFSAERAPTWPGAHPSVVVGTNLTTTRQDLFFALVEATYHRLGQIIERLEVSLSSPLSLIVSGGTLRSPGAFQHLANVLGRTLYASRVTEASLRGAALFAWEKMGQALPPLPKGPAIRPKKSAARAYAQARLRQSRLEKEELRIG